MRAGERSVEREALLSMLILFLGGMTLQAFAAWSWNPDNASASRRAIARRSGERVIRPLLALSS